MAVWEVKNKRDYPTDEIADVASGSPEGGEDEDELRGKLNTILDLAAPGSADEEDDEDV